MGVRIYIYINIHRKKYIDIYISIFSYIFSYMYVYINKYTYINMRICINI